MHSRPARHAITVRRARSGLRWVGATLLLCCVGSGCRHSEPRPSSPKRTRGIGAPTTVLPSRTEPTSFALTDPGQNPDQFVAQGMPANAAAPSGERADDAEQRDFSAELVRMFGDPASCVAPRATETGPSQLPIALSTRIMPSGAVADSAVSAPGLEATEVQCLRRRLEALHFGPPIENAPFPVHGSVTLTRNADASNATAQAAAAARKPAEDKPQSPWEEPEAPAPVAQNTDVIEPPPSAAVIKGAEPHYEDPWQEPAAPAPVVQSTENAEP